MKKVTLIMTLFTISFIPPLTFAIETAPRISDREIVEALTEIRGDIKRVETGLKGDIKRLEDGQKALDKRIDDLRSEMNSRFDTLQWMFGVFITIALLILGSVLRMQWQMHKRQTRMETTVETQKDELLFLKGLIEKLLPPKGAL